MKSVLIFILIVSGILKTQALVISEIMSNPIGDDSGREWVEIYNNGSSTVEVSSLTLSIKGGTPIVVTPVSGGASIPASGYAVIGSTVSGATKFLQDYPSYSGVLMKSSISLVNTGVTSIDIRLSGAVVDTLASYTAAKEGYTISLVGSSFVLGTPTPGAHNQADAGAASSASDTTSTATSSNQVTVPQMSAALPDMVLYMPFERMVVAGAPTEFVTSATTHAGKAIDNLSCLWAFGDGGQGTGTSTTYRYAYPGRYIVHNECTNGLVSGYGYTFVRVVSPDITISGVGSGKYGSYLDITNPNEYDLDLSQWRISIDGALFPFPKNTSIAARMTTRFSGLAMGFSGVPLYATTRIKILFPTLEEVVVYQPIQTPSAEPQVLGVATSTNIIPPPTKKIPAPKKVLVSTASSTVMASTTSSVSAPHREKDTRIVTFFRSFFGK